MSARPGPHSFFFVSIQGAQISGIVTVEPGPVEGRVLLTLVAAGNRLDPRTSYRVVASLGGHVLEVAFVSDGRGIGTGEASREVPGDVELVPLVTVSGPGF